MHAISTRPGHKSGVEWAWESEQQSAFEAIKQVIMTLPVLAYFYKTKKHTIQCDASKKMLGAVLLQESKPVMYMSTALTETEQRYSNIERELLAIVFALERLNHYTFGRTIKFRVTTSLCRVFGRSL